MVNIFDWKHIIIAFVIAVCVSIVSIIVAEGTSVHGKEVDIHSQLIKDLYDRVYKLEASSHPATSKRYTADDAARDKAMIYACIKDKRDCP